MKRICLAAALLVGCAVAAMGQTYTLDGELTITQKPPLAAMPT